MFMLVVLILSDGNPLNRTGVQKDISALIFAYKLVKLVLEHEAYLMR